MNPKTTFHADSVLAENLNLPMIQPERSNPMAFAAGPIIPDKPDDLLAFCRNWYSIYFGIKVNRPINANM